MDILQEHLPSGISVLVVGPPGSGKTILSQQLVRHLLRKDKFAVCIASKSQINQIMSQKKLFSWDATAYLKNKQLGVVEIGDVADPTELNINLTQVIKQSKRPLSLVVVDSLTMLMVGMEERKIMKFTEALIRKFQVQNVSLMLLATPTKETEDFLTKMKSLVSSVIEIKLRERGTIRRYMRIFKFLERRHSTQWYTFEITDSGIQFAAVPVKTPGSDELLLPKLKLQEEVSTPYPGLDNLMERIQKKGDDCILEAKFDSGKGVMLFSEGEHLTSIFAGKDTKRSKAPQHVRTSIKTKKGSLAMYSLRPGTAPLLVGYLEDQALFKNLSSEQVRFEEIVENLSESAFSGCILLRSDEEQGLIFIEEGDVVEAYFENERILQSKEALAAFEDATSRGNFVVDIYFSTKMEKLSEKVEEAPVPAVPEAMLPEFIPVKGATVQGKVLPPSFRGYCN
jgi:KaiC/GvpD/RAD55 family RecA-like ATPase